MYVANDWVRVSPMLSPTIFPLVSVPVLGNKIFVCNNDYYDHQLFDNCPWLRFLILSMNNGKPSLILHLFHLYCIKSFMQLII